MSRIRKIIPGRQTSEQGSVLVVAIMVIVTMLIIAIPFLFRLSAQSRTTEKGYRSEAAFHLAEAGVEKTLWRINEPYSLPGATDPEAIQWTTDGTNQIGIINDLRTSDSRVVGDIRIVQGPPSATEPSMMTLQSTGSVPFIAAATVNRTVRVNLEKYYKSIFDLGFFVDDYFYIHNAFSLDSYDSAKGAYDAALGDGTRNSGGSTIFGTNSYTHASRPRNPGDASWLIDAGGQSSQIYGTIAAGGNAAADNDPLTPDTSVLKDVINVPKESVFADNTVPSRVTMNQKYDLNSVDVFDLPPKEYMGQQQNVASWFQGYTSTQPDAASYYQYRMDRVPYISEIDGSYFHASGYSVPAGGSTTLRPQDSGVYTSLLVGTESQGANLNIEGGNVTLYITEVADHASAVGRFLMGPGSNINIAPDASLTLILGNASFVVGKSYTINQTSGTPADCLILGTDQFVLPASVDPDRLPKKLSQLDDIPGLMYFEHGAGSDNGEIYGAIYVPRAHITTGQGQNHLSIYGACLAASMDFKVQVDFHYDEALGAFNIKTGGFPYWRVQSWQELLGAN